MNFSPKAVAIALVRPEDGMEFIRPERFAELRVCPGHERLGRRASETIIGGRARERIL